MHPVFHRHYCNNFKLCYMLLFPSKRTLSCTTLSWAYYNLHMSALISIATEFFKSTGGRFFFFKKCYSITIMITVLLPMQQFWNSHFTKVLFLLLWHKPPGTNSSPCFCFRKDRKKNWHQWKWIDLFPASYLLVFCHSNTLSESQQVSNTVLHCEKRRIPLGSQLSVIWERVSRLIRMAILSWCQQVAQTVCTFTKPK